MNRTLQPEIQELVQFNILPPVRTVMPNGVPLTIINAGEQDVVRDRKSTRLNSSH